MLRTIHSTYKHYIQHLYTLLTGQHFHTTPSSNLDVRFPRERSATDSIQLEPHEFNRKQKEREGTRQKGKRDACSGLETAKCGKPTLAANQPPEYRPVHCRFRLTVMRGFQHSVTQRITQRNVRSRSAAPTATFRIHWLNVIAALIGRVRLRRCGKNRCRFYLLAERRKKLQAPLRRLRCVKKVRNTFCCVKTLALRCVTFTLRYGMMETRIEL